MKAEILLRREKGRYTRLLDSWKAPEGAGRPIGCIATSFTFDPVFFEEECVARFLRLDSDPNEDGLAYLIEREEKLAEARVVALVDYRHADPMRSMRWDLLPVRVPGAAQHAKLSFLAWEGVVRLIVASANLTEPGYRSNLEVFANLDFHNGGKVHPDLLFPGIDFLRRMVRGYVHGDPNEAGPLSRSLSLLKQIESIARGIEPAKRRTRLQVIPLFSGISIGERHDTFNWLREETQKRGRSQSAIVVSPFFDDSNPAALKALQDVMLKKGDRRIDFVTNGSLLEDERVQLSVPGWIVDDKPARLQIMFHRPVSEEGEDYRHLHAKTITLDRPGAYSLLILGSSNFTRAGLGLGDGPINLEANLGYLLRHKNSSSSGLRAVLPLTDGPYSAEEVVFDPQRDPELDDLLLPILPMGFQEALYHPRAEGGELILRFGKGLPDYWRIFDPEGQPILSSEALRAMNGPPEVRHELTQPRPVSFLEVQWERPENGTSHTEMASARWAVNVTEPALLPPPEELRTLPLETLLQILTSARPLHETLVRLLRRQSKKQGGGKDPDLDPLKRYRDETQLLYRTRKVARALEQMRIRLERPVLHQDALRWRLEGPVGPLALARALVKEARTNAEGAFLVAEVALTVSSVKVRQHSAGLPKKRIQKQLAQCVDQLRQEIDPAALTKGNPQMKAYVEKALQRAGV